MLLTYTNSNNNCKIDDDGESIARSPDFTVTGRRGATLSVTRIGTQGQLISRTGATSFTFENDGIRREFTTGGGQTLFRFTTQTTSAIGISGVSRDDRVVNGGTLKITNNLTNDFCSVSPNNVTWQTGCNCAVSGNWAGTCSDGDSVAMVLQGCGQATITKGSVETSIIFDRCYSTL